MTSTPQRPFRNLAGLMVALTLLVGACGDDPTTDATGESSTADTTHSPSTNDDASTSVSEQWAAFVNGFIEDFFAAHPVFAVSAGRHEFDGQLPDWSREGIAAEIARLHAARDAALAFDREALSAEERYQQDYVVSQIDETLFWLETARWPFRNPQFYFGWTLDSLTPAPYITLTYAPIEERMRAFTRYARAVPTAIQQIRDNLETPMPRTWIDYGVASFGGMAQYLTDDVPLVWEEVEDQQLQLEFAEANTAAATAMAEMAEYLESLRETQTEDFALGAETFSKMLYDTERVEVSLEELEAVGRADLERNQQALAEACEGFAPGESIRDCFARMANNKPMGGSVEAARQQLDELKAFLVKEDLVTIPGDEVARVDEAPPYARSNFAYINIPGPYEEGQPSTYYIAPPDPSWSEEVQRGYVPGEADLLGTSVHEVWPGHFLNFLHANRADWIFGRAFVGYAFAEGWAHYTEEMMIEAGLRDGDLETHIGQLSNALLRNARFLSAIGLHTQGWTVEESEAFFRNEAYQDAGNSEQQAARGTYDPAYLNYTMGKLMIRKLREDWTATRGGRDAWKAFHDEFLSYGGPPIPLVRGQMLNEEPKAVF